MTQLMIICILAVTAAADARVVVGDFSHGELDDWSNKVFDGVTRYTLVTDNARQVLKAESRNAASGLFKRIRIDLTKTPYLHWSWKVPGTLGNIDEHTKAGDDYPARVYVIFSGGALFWRTRAINYVWSSDQPRGSTWQNAFTGNARMIAVRSGNGETGRWVHERRDVRGDYRRLFGSDVRYADSVAIMTDTDNTHKSAVAFYGDIYFSSE